MAIPNAVQFIRGFLGPDIDRDVRERDRSRKGDRYLPFVQIAKEWASRYRELRKDDPELPMLYVDDFKDFLRYEYLVGSPMFYKLAPKRR